MAQTKASTYQPQRSQPGHWKLSHFGRHRSYDGANKQQYGPGIPERCSRCSPRLEICPPITTTRLYKSLRTASQSSTLQPSSNLHQRAAYLPASHSPRLKQPHKQHEPIPQSSPSSSPPLISNNRQLPGGISSPTSKSHYILEGLPAYLTHFRTRLRRSSSGKLFHSSQSRT